MIQPDKPIITSPPIRVINANQEVPGRTDINYLSGIQNALTRRTMHTISERNRAFEEGYVPSPLDLDTEIARRISRRELEMHIRNRVNPNWTTDSEEKEKRSARVEVLDEHRVEHDGLGVITARGNMYTGNRMYIEVIPTSNPEAFIVQATALLTPGTAIYGEALYTAIGERRLIALLEGQLGTTLIPQPL